MARSISSIAVIFGLALLHGVALAQSRGDAQGYPARPIRIIVANTAGSAMDNVTRMIGQRLAEDWGQQVVADDRPGAGGILGHEIAAKAAPDGYTLLLAASAGVVINPLLSRVPYDSVRDFAPISLVITSIQMLSSHPSVAAVSVEELLALARARPGQLNCGSSGQNSSNHLACEMLKVMGHVDFVHVPFKGTVPQMTGIVSGQVQFGFASIPTTMTQVRAGKLRALAQGGSKRSPVVPDVPTVAETLPDFRAVTWYALFVPRDAARDRGAAERRSGEDTFRCDDRAAAHDSGIGSCARDTGRTHGAHARRDRASVAGHQDRGLDRRAA